MRVDQAVSGSPPPCLVEHGLREGGQLVEKAGFVDLLGRTNGQPGHPALFGEANPVRPRCAGAPGEDLGRDAAPAELLADCPQVDVHPAVFARPKGSDRRSVDADDRERFQWHPPWCGDRTPFIVAVCPPPGQLRMTTSGPRTGSNPASAVLGWCRILSPPGRNPNLRSSHSQSTR